MSSHEIFLTKAKKSAIGKLNRKMITIENRLKAGKYGKDTDPAPTWLVKDLTEALAHAKASRPDLADDFTREPECPYCGVEIDVSFKDEWFDGTSFQRGCHACGELFELTVDVDITFRTDKER